MSLVLTDKGFELPTEPCRNAVTTARELLTWMYDNVDSATHVANKVVSGLEKCFSSKARNPRTRRDKHCLSNDRLLTSELSVHSGCTCWFTSNIPAVDYTVIYGKTAVWNI